MIYLGENQLDNIYIGSSSVDYIYLGDVQVYPYEHDYSRDYFTTVALSSGTISFSGASTATTLSYSTDRGQTWSTAEQNQSVSVSSGDKVLWKGTNSGTTTAHGIGKFYASSSYDVEGNAHSLFYEDDFRGRTDLPNKNYSHAELFRGSTTLKNAENLVLPATQMNPYTYLNMFYDCTSLETAPQLPARTLARACYQYMFNNCTSLTEAPALTARTLAQECYNGMFYGCTSLTEAPALPATTLNISCYMRMFRGCSGLTTPMSVLPATNLAYCDDCYREMFCSCTAMTSAPELPATTLAYECYRDMFYECRSLTEAPELPATTLTGSCYQSMFNRCSNLTEAPELPATTLVSMCYQSMFKDCSILSAITCHATDISAFNSTNGWVYGVAASGVFTKPEEMESWTVGQNGIPVGWTVQDITHDYSQDYFTTKALSSGTISFSGSSSNSLSYSTDSGQTWSTASQAPSVNVSSGDKVLWKGTTVPIASDGIGRFSSTASFDVEGNALSLLYGDNFKSEAMATSDDFYNLLSGSSVVSAENLILPEYTSPNSYNGMFRDSTIVTAPQLPARTLASSCYQSMFKNCTSLTSAPSLDGITSIGYSSLRSMFVGCTSITTAPVINSINVTINESGCQEMFSGCTALTSVQESFNFTYIGTSGCTKMFAGCTSLTTAPVINSINVTIDDSGCQEMFSGCTALTSVQESFNFTSIGTSGCTKMFAGCTSLTEAPNINVYQLGSRACSNMFQACSSLTSAPELPATTLADSCYRNMFQNCSSLTEAPELPATTLAANCYQSMFQNCSSLTEAPELPATTLAANCYQTMFQNCSSLSAITCHATNISAYNCTFSWVSGVAASGVFTKPAEMESWTVGTSGIPVGWTVQPITHDYSQDYFTTKALSSGTISYSGNSLNYMSYSTDGGDTWSTGSMIHSVQVSASDKVLWKCTARSYSNGIGRFSSSGNFDIEGNAMSLIYGDNFQNQISLSGKMSVLNGLFSGSTTLISAANLVLPATTLAFGCYAYMFHGCTNLTTAPELLATTLDEYCYIGMFRGCTSLTEAPELPATTLAQVCYNEMFMGCTSLTEAPELPATTLDYRCYQSMFSNCTSLTSAPQLSATTLADKCYSKMFQACDSLTGASALPATTLAEGCYEWMFNFCPLTDAPELPATTLVKDCYKYMFSDCSSLSAVTCLAEDISASSCTYEWLGQVARNGVFTKSANMNDWTSGDDGIPTYWTVEDKQEPQPTPWPTCTDVEPCCQDSRMMTAGEALNDIQGEYVEDRFVNITIYEGTIYDGEWYFTNYGDQEYVLGLRSDGSGDWESSSDGENWDTVTFYSGEATFDCYNIYSGDVGFYNRGQSSEQYVPFSCYATFWFGDESCSEEGGGDEPEPDPEEGE